MCLVIEVLRVVEYEGVTHVLAEVYAIEIVIPDTSLRDHKEA